MSEKKIVIRTGGLSLSTGLFLLFLGLKLTHYIDWSWWWVTSPLWIPWLILGAIVMVPLTIAAIIGLFTAMMFCIAWVEKKVRK